MRLSSNKEFFFFFQSALENAEDFFIVLSSVLDVLTSPAAMGELSLGCLGPVASSQVLSRPVSRGSRTGERKAMTITTGFKSEGSLGDFFAEGGAKTSPLEPALTISNGKAQSFWAEQFPNDVSPVVTVNKISTLTISCLF